jgi:hypothetical protein
VLYVLDDINDNELKGLDFFENVFRMAHADKNHSTTTKQAGMLDEVRIVPLFVAARAAGIRSRMLGFKGQLPKADPLCKGM